MGMHHIDKHDNFTPNRVASLDIVCVKVKR